MGNDGVWYCRVVAMIYGRKCYMRAQLQRITGVDLLKAANSLWIRAAKWNKAKTNNKCEF